MRRLDQLYTHSRDVQRLPALVQRLPLKHDAATTGAPASAPEVS